MKALIIQDPQRGKGMIAIPVMRRRVAPVLNWCSRIMIFSEHTNEKLAEELRLQDLTPLEGLQLLQKKGVTTLILGTLSSDLEQQARGLGLKIISGIAGEVDQVLKAYWEHRLDQPEFWLPGYRGVGKGKAFGFVDLYRCPTCGPKAPHDRGIPCIHVTCPRCGKPMVRDER
jgi:hypothetical protein